MAGLKKLYLELILGTGGVIAITLLMYFLQVDGKLGIPYPIIVTISMTALVTVLIWLGCRIIVKYLWDKYPWEKHPLKHLLIETFAILAWSTFIMGLSGYTYNTITYCTSFEEGAGYDDLVIGLLVTLLITSIHESAYFYRQWKEHFHLSVKLKKDNLEARYETLKAQLNPHFLFNSLNTLITMVDDNPKAANYVQNLADFMRYVLINKDKELILIQEELESCEKYLFLQESRFGANLSWSIQLDEETVKSSIAPLTIQLLLENAIKHNIISKDKPLIINIKNENNEFICIENNLQKKMTGNSTGQGLKNIMARYEYLTSLKPRVETDEHSFKVFIPILKSIV